MSAPVGLPAMLDDAARRRLILSDRWIGYPLAAGTVARIVELLRRPRVSRMRSLLVHGDSGMGKTLIRLKIERDFPAGFPVAPEEAPRPLVSLQMPARPDERRFFAHLLDALGAPPRPRDTLHQVEIAAIKLLRHLRPAAFLLDEFQHLGAASARDAQAMLNLIKFLANDLAAPVIGFGTDAALHVIKTDRQLDSRFLKHPLPLWRDTPDFADLVASILAAMPLRDTGGGVDRKLVRTVLQHSGGVTGEVFHLLVTAAHDAVGAAERVTAEAVEAVARGAWRDTGHDRRREIA